MSKPSAAVVLALTVVYAVFAIWLVGKAMSGR